mmetsp:Transcript_93895/g.265671  ORF Transcript_93895/g.265671 Transcript_93895/m.265671 type:complete len:331 (-) Transcript_93895:413-1405(-)
MRASGQIPQAHRAVPEAAACLHVCPAHSQGVEGRGASGHCLHACAFTEVPQLRRAVHGTTHGTHRLPVHLQRRELLGVGLPGPDAGAGLDVPELELPIEGARDRAHCLPVHRHDQNGRCASRAKATHQLTILQAPQLEAAVAGARERVPQPRVARAADEVHRDALRGHPVVLERRVVRHRLGPPHELLRGGRHAQARGELLLQGTDADGRLGRDAGQAPAPHVAHCDLEAAVGRAQAAGGVLADHGRRACGRGRDVAARGLLHPAQGGHVGGYARHLELGCLPEPGRDEGVGVRWPLAQQQLEERVHKLMQPVPIKVGPCLGLRVPSAHW